MSDTITDLMMRYTLRLSSDWQVDRVVMDTEPQRVDVYLSHSGKNLVCPETGEGGTFCCGDAIQIPRNPRLRSARGCWKRRNSARRPLFTCKLNPHDW